MILNKTNFEIESTLREVQKDDLTFSEFAQVPRICKSPRLQTSLRSETLCLLLLCAINTTRHKHP